MVLKCRRYVSQSFLQRSVVAMLYMTLGDVFTFGLANDASVVRITGSITSRAAHAWAIRALSHTAEHPSKRNMPREDVVEGPVTTQIRVRGL